jgi:hypothetical protein
VVLGRAHAAGPRDADGDRHLHVAAGAVVELGHLAHDLVEGGVDEPVELDLDDRAVAAHREAHGGAHDARLGQRRVDHALSAELVLESVGDAEHAAELADVLAHDEHLRVVGHRATETFVDGLGHGEPRHRAAPSSSVANPSR